jgi:hypothetical protein
MHHQVTLSSRVPFLALDTTAWIRLISWSFFPIVILSIPVLYLKLREINPFVRIQREPVDFKILSFLVTFLAHSLVETVYSTRLAKEKVKRASFWAISADL